MAWISICIKNVAVIICFTVLAIHFGHWWIALFSILVFSSIETRRHIDEEEQNGISDNEETV